MVKVIVRQQGREIGSTEVNTTSVEQGLKEGKAILKMKYRLSSPSNYGWQAINMNQ